MLPQDSTGRIHRDTFIVSANVSYLAHHLIVRPDLNSSIAGGMLASHRYALHHTLPHAKAALLRRRWLLTRCPGPPPQQSHHHVLADHRPHVSHRRAAATCTGRHPTDRLDANLLPLSQMGHCLRHASLGLRRGCQVQLSVLFQKAD